MMQGHSAYVTFSFCDMCCLSFSLQSHLIVKLHFQAHALTIYVFVASFSVGDKPRPSPLPKNWPQIPKRGCELMRAGMGELSPACYFGNSPCFCIFWPLWGLIQVFAGCSVSLFVCYLQDFVHIVSCSAFSFVYVQ